MEHHRTGYTTGAAVFTLDRAFSAATKALRKAKSHECRQDDLVDKVTSAYEGTTNSLWANVQRNDLCQMVGNSESGLAKQLDALRVRE